MKVMCWTHHDLDGLVSALLVKWAHPDMEFEYQTTSPQTFRDDYTKWLINHDPERDYERVFFTDLDLSENQDLPDFPNSCIIDHHNMHVEAADNYQHAITVIDNYSSACLLIYRTFKKWFNLKLTIQQKVLIKLGDDQDSHQNKIPASNILNAVFWSTQNRFPVFINQLDKGFTGLTNKQKAIYRLYKKDLQQKKDNLEYFIHRKCKLFQGVNIVTEDHKNINDNHYYVIATFCDKYINEIADYLFDEYDCDIAIVVNMRTNHVSWRRNDSCKIDLGRVAEVLTDGGGHPYSSGGYITEQFKLFTKRLKPKKRNTLLRYKEDGQD